MQSGAQRDEPYSNLLPYDRITASNWLHERALQLQNEGSIDNALAHLDHAIQCNISNSKALATRAKLYNEKKMHTEAKLDIQTLGDIAQEKIAFNKQYSEDKTNIHHELSYLAYRFLRKAHYAETIRHASSVIESAHNPIIIFRSYCYRATAHIKLKLWAQAKSDLTQIITDYHKNPLYKIILTPETLKAQLNEILLFSIQEHDILEIHNTVTKLLEAFRWNEEEEFSEIRSITRLIDEEVQKQSTSETDSNKLTKLSEEIIINMVRRIKNYLTHQLLILKQVSPLDKKTKLIEKILTLYEAQSNKEPTPQRVFASIETYTAELTRQIQNYIKHCENQHFSLSVIPTPTQITDIATLILKSIAHKTLKDYDTQIKYYKQALQLFPSFYLIKAQLGCVLIANRTLDPSYLITGITHIQEALELPNDPSKLIASYFALGVGLAEAKEFNRAKHILLQAIRLQKEYSDSPDSELTPIQVNEIATCIAAINKNEITNQTSPKIRGLISQLSNTPTHHPIYCNLSKEYYSQENYEIALEYLTISEWLRQHQLNPTNTPEAMIHYLILLRNINIKLGNISAASHFHTRALKYVINIGKAILMTTSSQLLDSENIKELLKSDLSTKLKKQKSKYSAESNHILSQLHKIKNEFRYELCEKGKQYIGHGEFINAIECFDFIITVTPDDPSIYIERGIAYQQLGDQEKAKQDFNKTLSLTDTEKNHLYKRAKQHLSFLNNENKLSSNPSLEKNISVKTKKTKSKPALKKNIPASLKQKKPIASISEFETNLFKMGTFFAAEAAQPTEKAYAEYTRELNDKIKEAKERKITATSKKNKKLSERRKLLKTVIRKKTNEAIKTPLIETKSIAVEEKQTVTAVDTKNNETKKINKLEHTKKIDTSILYKLPYPCPIFDFERSIITQLKSTGAIAFLTGSSVPARLKNIDLPDADSDIHTTASREEILKCLAHWNIYESRKKGLFIIYLPSGRKIEIFSSPALKISQGEYIENCNATINTWQVDENGVASTYCTHAYNDLFFNDYLRSPIPPKQSFIADPTRILRNIYTAERFDKYLPKNMLHAIKECQHLLLSTAPLIRINLLITKLLTCSKHTSILQQLIQLNLLNTLFPVIGNLLANDKIWITSEIDKALKIEPHLSPEKLFRIFIVSAWMQSNELKIGDIFTKEPLIKNLFHQNDAIAQFNNTSETLIVNWKREHAASNTANLKPEWDPRLLSTKIRLPQLSNEGISVTLAPELKKLT